jgi:hypothetical protein
MTINPNELRLGNWICDNQNPDLIFTVHGITEDSLLVYPIIDNLNAEWMPISDFAPITLNNDLLKILGFKNFEQQNGYARFDVRKSDEFSSGCSIFIENSQVRISDDTSEVIELPEKTWYIHNIQNIISAIV